MKKLAIAFGILGGLVVAAVLAVEFLVDLNAFRPQIITPMEAALNRDVELGDVSLSLFQRGAKVSNITIFEPEHSDVFVQVKDIVAQVKLLPLLSQKVEVAKIVVDQPSVNITRHADGGWNFDDLIGQPAAATPADTEPAANPAEQENPAPASEPESPDGTASVPSDEASPDSEPRPTTPAASPLSQFTLDTFQLRKGAVTLVDNSVNMTTALTDINADVTGFAANSPLTFDLSASLNDGQYGRISTSGQVGPLPADMNLTALDMDIRAALEDIDLSHFQAYYKQGEEAALRTTEKLNATMTLSGALNTLLASNGNVSVGDVTMDVSGTVEQASSSPKVDLTVSLPNVPWEKVLELLPPDVSAALDGLDISGLGDMTIQPKGTLDQLVVAGEFDLSQAGLTYQTLFSKPEATTMSLSFNTTITAMNAVEISALTLTLGDLELNLSGSVKNFTAPELDMRLSSNAFALEPLMALFPDITTPADPDAPALALKGNGQLEATVTGSLDDLAVSGVVDMSKADIAYGDAFSKPADMPGTLEFDAGLKEMDAVEVRKVRLNLNDVILDITGMITNLKQDAMLDLRITSNRFALNQIAPFTAGLGVAPSGTTELDLAVATSVKNIDLANLVTGSLRLTDAGIAAPQLPKPVSNVNALVSIDGDVVTLDDFSAVMGASSVTGQATVANLFETPEITFTLHAPVLNVDELVPPAEQAASARPRDAVVDLRPFRRQRRAGMAQPSAFAFAAASTASEAPLIPPIARQLTTTGTLTIDQGVAKNVHFANLTADVDLRSGVLTIDDLLVDLYDGTYEGDITLDMTKPDPMYAVQSKLVHVDSNPALKDTTSLADVVYGFLFADASIQGQGFTMDKIAQTLAGEGAFTIEEGKIATLDLWTEMAAVFQTLGTLAQVNELTKIGKELAAFPAETQFSRLAGSFRLQQGEAGSSDLIMEIPQNNLHVALLLEGSLGLDTALDFLGKIRFAPESKYYADLERSFRNFKQPDGSIELPFPIPIGGTLLEPEFNRKSLQQSLANVGKEMAKQAVKQELENQALKLLQQALPTSSNDSADTPTDTGQPAQPSTAEPTPTPTPTPENILEEVGKGLLDNLFK